MGYTILNQGFEFLIFITIISIKGWDYWVNIIYTNWWDEQIWAKTLYKRKKKHEKKKWIKTL